jgi:hypothetical protein
MNKLKCAICGKTKNKGKMRFAKQDDGLQPVCKKHRCFELRPPWSPFRRSNDTSGDQEVQEA